jgi:hypothetical protein
MPRKGEYMNRIINQKSRGWKKAILVMAILAWGIGVPQINPVPDLQAAETLTASGKELIIHGRGTIDWIKEGELIIEDTLMPISPSVDYFSQSNGLPAFPEEFQAGVFVGFRLDEKKEIIELWLLDNKQ